MLALNFDSSPPKAFSIRIGLGTNLPHKIEAMRVQEVFGNRMNFMVHEFRNSNHSKISQNTYTYLLDLDFGKGQFLGGYPDICLKFLQ